MVTWVLENDSRYHRMSVNQQILDRCAETGHSSMEITIVPFERSVVGGDPILDGPVVVYGSTAMDSVVQRNNWFPGTWRVEEVRESHVFAALGDLYMNSDVVVCPVRDAAQRAVERGWEHFFVKPDTDHKEFAGTVTDPERYPFFIEPMLEYEWVPEDFNVCVSSVKNIGIEWRLVVVDGKVIEYSIYKQWQTVMPSREIYPEVLEIAEQAITLHNPAPVFVIDIGQIDGHLKVIEYNGFNSSGLYACDVANIVDAVNSYVEHIYYVS